ncbi:hypothetical protein YTPLAS18_38780 [Nitrospira sp.]|nr:hypothetical protein YTPLAS18_38780 [Nitrospira sp.]
MPVLSMLIQPVSSQHRWRFLLRSAVGLALVSVWSGYTLAEPVVRQSTLYRGAALPHVESSGSRLCRPSDMVGTWQLVGYGSRRDLTRTDAPYAYPYQVFRFGHEGTMQSAHSRTAFLETPAQILARVPTDLRYEMAANSQGLLTVTPRGAEEPAETWYCRTLTVDQIDLARRMLLRRGDVVLTLVGKSGAPLFTRHLRKY